MKKLIFAVALLTVVYSLKGQDRIPYENQIQEKQNRDHVLGEFILSGSPNMMFNYPYGNNFAGGIKISVFVSKHFSFDSDLVIGKDYTHFGPGIFGLPLWLVFFSPGGLSFSSEEGDSFFSFLAGLVLMIASAEHFAYHFPVASNFEISPYLSLLRIKQLSNVNDQEFPDGIVSGSSFVLGMEFNRYIKNFVISPYAEYNVTYNGSLQGFNFGIYLGYNFTRKR